MLASTPRFYPLVGMLAGYCLLFFTSPVRVSLRDGARCLLRFKRLWLIFAVLALAYSAFHFIVFSPLGPTPDLRLEQFRFWQDWHWPGLGAIWRDSLLHTAESVAGIFDAAATTYPLSVLAAILLIFNWRGLHRSLVRALRKQFGSGGWLIYIGVLCGALASLLKPLIYWRVPEWIHLLSPAHVLQASAIVDTVAFIFEYLCAVYIQVYLITVCLAWIKGLHFGEEALLRFAMRRFSFVLRWLGFVILASTVLLRVPLLVAYFQNLPGMLDYLPVGRWLLAGFILCFCVMQISLVLHNETLHEALLAQCQFFRRHLFRLLWFILLAAVNYWLLALADSAVHIAAAERPLALIAWKLIYIATYSFVTGWLLASWVCLFRQCEIGRINRETWIRY